MDCIHSDTLVSLCTVLLQAVTTGGNGGGGNRRVSVLGGALLQRVHPHEQRQRAVDGARSLPRGPRPHGHSPVCVSAHQLLPRDSGALGTAETFTPRAWPCALTCTFRKRAAQAGPARVSTFLHLELSQGTPATSAQP